MTEEPIEYVYKRIKKDLGDRSKGKTKQSFKDECDINLIMKKHENGGESQHINKALETYGDFTKSGDFTSAHLAVKRAEEGFAALPAHVRDAMGNDPRNFLAKCEDPEYLDNFTKMGVYDPHAAPELPVMPETPKKEMPDDDPAV